MRMTWAKNDRSPYLIFCRKTFLEALAANWLILQLSVTRLYLPTCLAHSAQANCSMCLRFEGCLLQTVCFSYFHRCSIGFRSRLLESHLEYSKVMVYSWVLLNCEFLGPYSFRHWAVYFTIEFFGISEISLYPIQI